MSVHVIQYRDGKKVMIPVADRKTYMEWRDSEQNRKADKQHMVQMNYSCLPNDDGTLKGSKRMSTTIGADIDVPVDKDFVLSKKDELGLLMFENSATKEGCGHVVCRRVPELTQEENLKRISSILGVEYDKGAKDITRVFYTPADKLVYLDDEIFKIEEAQTVEKRGDSSITVPGTVIGKNVEIPSPSSLIAFDLCVKNAGLNAENMDVWGEHNWHTNLMAVLSVGLPKLMSKEQLLAVVNAKLPNYSQTEDCKKLIEYFYENYTADKGFMTVTLREINAKAQELSRTEGLNGSNGSSSSNGASGTDDGEGVLEEITEGWEPPKMPKKIPRLVDLELRDFDPRYRESLGLTSTVGHSGIASHFRAKYLNNKILTPAMMVSVIGGSGSGKDYCTQLFNAQMLHTLDDNDDREWAKVRANAELREKMKNSKECPPKYHPKIRVFESASKTSLLELQTNLGANGMLVGIFSEADGFVGASQASWSNISVLLRKGYSGDKQRQFYMAESTCNTNTPLNISLLMEGTPKAILERMFSDRNCENGTMQRFVPVLMPKKKRTFRPPMQNFLTEDERKERDALLMELYQKDLALGDDTLVLETPKTCNAIGQWFDSLEERYNDGLMTEAEADLSRRCGEFILRAAIPLIALYGETKEVVDYSVWVGDMAYYNMCRIYGHRVQEDLNASNELMTARLDARKTAEPLLDKMPMIFNIKQFKEERVKAGQSTNVKMLLSRYCKNGKLEKVGRGVYRKKTLPSPPVREGDKNASDSQKGNIVSVTKMTDTNGTNDDPTTSSGQAPDINNQNSGDDADNG